MNNQDKIMIEKETTDKIEIKTKNGLNEQEQEVKMDNMSDLDKTTNGLGEKWPEPIIRVQSLAESNLATVPDRFIKPPSQRPNETITINQQPEDGAINIPVIDLSSILSGNQKDKERISEACREFGFFQVKKWNLMLCFCFRFDYSFYVFEKCFFLWFNIFTI